MRVAVIGGGLQGCCLAMELANAGAQVDLYDRAHDLLTQASSCNEGKLHLGYVYANDPTLASARLMVQGATAFASLLRRWIGASVETLEASVPFHYIVPRGSLLSADQIERHLRACHAIACEAACEAPDYFGEDCREPPVRLSRHESYDPDRVEAVFRTREIAIDAEVMARLIRRRIAEIANIQPILRANVASVAIAKSRVAVDFVKDADRLRETYDHVINAAWDGRLAIDASAGIVPSRPWLFRFKCYARVRASPAPSVPLPSTTMVLGPYGDVVDYGHGDYYLSWYPASLIGRSSGIVPPAWTATLSETAARSMLQAIQSGLAQFLPAVAALRLDDFHPRDIKGGVIFAWGNSDIDDPGSQLHERATIGPQHHGRYHSINTGKLTMAPLFAKLTADRILSS